MTMDDELDALKSDLKRAIRIIERIEKHRQSQRKYRAKHPENSIFHKEK
jgi:hypothetical protein